MNKARLAFVAGEAGGTAPAWLNGANEVANAAFLEGLIPWTAIATSPVTQMSPNVLMKV